MKTPKQKDSAAPAVTTGEDAIKWTKEKQKLQESYNVLAYVYGKEHLHEEAYFNNLNDLRLAALSAPAPLSSEAVGKKIDPLISEFVELMVSQLEANAGRGDWKEGLGMSYTIDAIARNLRDLQGYTPAETRTCADIANFALMHWIFRTMGRRAEALLTPSPSEKEKP